MLLAALWAIVNNAGIANRTFPVPWCKVEDFRKVLDVNLFGMADTTITLFPLLKRGGEGIMCFFPSLTAAKPFRITRLLHGNGIHEYPITHSYGFVPWDRTMNMKCIPYPAVGNITSYSRNFLGWIPLLYARNKSSITRGGSVPQQSDARTPWPSWGTAKKNRPIFIDFPNWNFLGV